MNLVDSVKMEHEKLLKVSKIEIARINTERLLNDFGIKCGWVKFGDHSKGTYNLHWQVNESHYSVAFEVHVPEWNRNEMGEEYEPFSIESAQIPYPILAFLNAMDGGKELHEAYRVEQENGNNVWIPIDFHNSEIVVSWFAKL
jgi:hypothetical protein